MKDVSDWEYVGEGVGDMFAHAQTMFLNEPLKAQDGTHKFTLDEIKKDTLKCLFLMCQIKILQNK